MQEEEELLSDSNNICNYYSYGEFDRIIEPFNRMDYDLETISEVLSADEREAALSSTYSFRDSNSRCGSFISSFSGFGKSIDNFDDSVFEKEPVKEEKIDQTGNPLEISGNIACSKRLLQYVREYMVYVKKRLSKLISVSKGNEEPQG